VSPRRNLPRRGGASRRAGDGPALDADRVRHGVESVQAYRDGDWTVRVIPGGAAAKTYRCPGCDQEIRPGVPHVVVWPTDGLGGAVDRRHWHSGCWRGRDRRTPTVRRLRRR
jgi:hypothetical protein